MTAIDTSKCTCNPVNNTYHVTIRSIKGKSPEDVAYRVKTALLLKKSSAQTQKQWWNYEYIKNFHIDDMIDVTKDPKTIYPSFFDELLYGKKPYTIIDNSNDTIGFYTAIVTITINNIPFQYKNNSCEDLINFISINNSPIHTQSSTIIKQVSLIE